MTLNRKEFLRLGAAAAVVTTASAILPAKVAAKVKPPQAYLIRNASILTMNANKEELYETDILIRDGRIVAIAKNITAGSAEIIPGDGKIIMPGMIDGHRHVWETILAARLVKSSKNYRDYLRYNNMAMGVVYTPEDLYFAQLIGGLSAIDNGVTSIVDHAHVIHSPEKGDAAAKGLKDSGIGGFFCYQTGHTPSYGAGDTISTAQASHEIYKEPDEWHLAHAAVIRDKYFSSSTDPLQFGVALGHIEFAPRTVESIRQEIVLGRRLGARLMTQHVAGRAGDEGMALPHEYRVITDLAKADLLGPDYHISHGNDLTDAELGYLRDSGGHIASSVMGEFPYASPSVHGRAMKAGVPVGIGIDVPLALTWDFFEHCRAALWGLHKGATNAAIVRTLESADILSFATSLGAKAIRMDDQIGSVEVGKRADLLMLRTDRFGFPPSGSLADRVLNFAYQHDIDATWIAGKQVKRDGKMIGVNWPVMKAQMEERQRRIFRDADSIRFTG